MTPDDPIHTVWECLIPTVWWRLKIYTSTVFELELKLISHGQVYRVVKKMDIPKKYRFPTELISDEIHNITEDLSMDVDTKKLARSIISTIDEELNAEYARKNKDILVQNDNSQYIVGNGHEV